LLLPLLRSLNNCLMTINDFDSMVRLRTTYYSSLNADVLLRTSAFCISEYGFIFWKPL